MGNVYWEKSQGNRIKNLAFSKRGNLPKREVLGSVLPDLTARLKSLSEALMRRASTYVDVHAGGRSAARLR